MKGMIKKMLSVLARRIEQFSLVSFILIICLAAAPRIGEAGQAEPKAGIQILNAALLDVMKRADELGYAGRYKILEPIIKDTFDFPFMAAKSTGRYWASLSEEQRALFIKTYSDWSIATYAGRFDGYSGERFELVSESAPVSGIVTVISKLIQLHEEPIVFSYLMRNVKSQWYVVDIQISGVSQLALYRAQFTDVMKSGGFEGLIAKLKNQTAGFAQPKK